MAVIHRWAVRIQLDCWKAEDLLQSHAIEHTIVVFGSTRIAEPPAARRALDSARVALTAAPDDLDRQRVLRVAERMVESSAYYDVARAFGRIVGTASKGRNLRHLIVMTGGGPGIMEAATRGAFDVGAETAGLHSRCRIHRRATPSA